MGEQQPVAYNFNHLHDIQNCPPQAAVAANGTFFAFHDSDPPDESDFQTAAQRNVFRGKDECVRRSNSVWSDLAALQGKLTDLKRRHPLRFSFISEGQLRNEHGVLDGGAGPHRSFWVCAKTSMHAIFTKRVI
jgi:hypothetical protein